LKHLKQMAFTLLLVSILSAGFANLLADDIIDQCADLYLEYQECDSDPQCREIDRQTIRNEWLGLGCFIFIIKF